MAENESLDLGNPGGQRWNQFHDAVSKGVSSKNSQKIQPGIQLGVNQRTLISRMIRKSY